MTITRLARASFAALETFRELGDGQPPTPEQREILRGWTGWGPLAPAFERPTPDGWKDLRDGLMAHLNTGEWRNSIQATATAFYTPPSLAAAMWRLLARLGLPGGQVLEPGCGSGLFIEHAPADLPVTITGVEKDPTTAGITGLLYPHAQIIAAGLEKVALRPSSFDAAIGNVPFADAMPHDPLIEQRDFGHAGYLNLHNYFIGRAVEAAKPGGLVLLITSRYTMDAGVRGESFRQAMARQAVLVGALRLPSNAFRDTGTGVVADVLLLRKLHPGETPPQADWLQSAYSAPLQADINDYWRAHPEMVLGRMEPRGGAQYGHLIQVTPPPTSSLNDLFELGLGRLAEAAERDGNTWQAGSTAASPVLEAASLNEGEFHLREDGTVTRIVDGEPTTVRASAELRRLVELKDQALQLFTLEADPDADADKLTEVRRETRDLYLAYVQAHGPLNRSHVRDGKPDPETGLPTKVRTVPSLGGIRNDPDWPTVTALEEWDDETETAHEAPILLRRINRPVQRATSTSSPVEAIALCADELGRFDLERVAELLQVDVDEALHLLGDLVFQDPVTEEWMPAEDYLSGNVRQRLREAQKAAEWTPARWGRNVTALAEVQPPDLTPEEIRASLGAPWIPPTIIARFLGHLFRVAREHIKIAHDPYTATWTITSPHCRGQVAASTTWGTAKANGVDIIEKALNGGVPVVTEKIEVEDPRNPGKTREITVRDEAETQLAQARLDAIQEEFGVWLWSDPDRATAMTTLYNERFNSLRLRDYDGSLYTWPGLATWFKPYKHQVDMAARVIRTKGAGTLCGYGVGAGKTAIMYLAALKMRQLGLVRKPAIVVPNHLLEQVAGDGRRLFPGARILMVTKDDLTKDRRKRFAAKVAARDWDAVVMTHTQFTAIPVSPQVQEEYINELIMQHEMAVQNVKGEGNNRIVKRLAKELLRLEARKEELLEARRDDGLCWEQLGIDFLFVDEAHFFKRLAAPTRMEGMQLGGSKRAEDLHLKLGWLREQNPDGRCGALFTGTPLTNTLAEAYTLLKYLDPAGLRERALHSFDAFGAQFIGYKTTIEVSPDGSGWRQYRRPAEFLNVPELRQQLGQVSDIRTRRRLQLAGPRNVQQEVEQVEPPPEMEQVIDSLVRRADAIRSGGVRPDEDNMLAVCLEGRMAALDLRLLGIAPSAPGKVERVAKRVAEIYRDHRDVLYPASGGDGFFHERPGCFQLVFCDLGTPQAKGGDQVYGWLRDAMVQRGIPAGQIRFIHDAHNDAERRALFSACRDGQISVLIASTEKAGTGVNVQARLRAVHHVDCTWRPDGIEQRNGRGDRPGNLNDDLSIIQYVTVGSFDPYMWQAVARKKSFIDQLTEGDPSVRVIQAVVSEEAQYYGMLKAIATGQEEVMELEQARADVAKLQALSAGHTRNQVSLRNRVRNHKDSIAAAQQRIPVLQRIAKIAAAAPAEALEFESWSRRPPLTDRDAVAAYLGETAREVAAGRMRNYVGTWRGIKVEFDHDLGRSVVAKIHDPQWYEGITVPLDKKWLRAKHEAQILAAIDDAIDSAADRIGELEARIDELEARIAETAPHLNQPFPSQQELEAALKRRAELEQQIAEGIAATDKAKLKAAA